MAANYASSERGASFLRAVPLAAAVKTGGGALHVNM